MHLPILYTSLECQTVHLNKSIKAKPGQAISNIHPLNDYTIPKGVDTAYAALVWDNHNIYNWIGLNHSNYPFPSQPGEISFSVTKRGKTETDGVLVNRNYMSVEKQEDGYVVLAFNNVEEGDKYAFSLFKKTKDDKHLNFSVSFYTPQPKGAGVKNETEVQKDDLLKIYGMTPKIVDLLKNEGITSFTDIVDADINDILALLVSHVVVIPNYRDLIVNTWQDQAYLGSRKEWTALDQLTKELAGAYPKESLFLT